jgi:glycerophosphoryl diester phosphodiesterase
MPEVIAHRGASAYAPEHTHAAFELAVELGADRLELDVRATADGELLVVHDPIAERPDGPRPLTLDAVLSTYRDRTRFLVELKDPEPAWERQVVAALARNGVADHTVVQTFDVAALRRLASSVAVAPLYDALPSPIALRTAARYAVAVGVRHETVDTAFLLRARAAGLPVWTWTVNAPADLERLTALGVAGLITDTPDRAHAAIAAAAVQAA